MATIKQIAEELGISPTTVSNVINGRTGKMSAETREKIEEALCKYHYETAGKSGGATAEENMIAVGFCMGRNKNVMTDPFCGELLGAIQRAVKSYGRYIVCLLYTSKESGAEGGLIRLHFYSLACLKRTDCSVGQLQGAQAPSGRNRRLLPSEKRRNECVQMPVQIPAEAAQIVFKESGLPGFCHITCLLYTSRDECAGMHQICQCGFCD